MTAKKTMRSARRGGYTLVEVMLAVSVMVIGATGFMGMQAAASRAVQGAQEQSSALAFLDTWLERVRRDGMNWTVSGTAGLASTLYMTPALVTAATWYVPAPTEPLESWGADYRGRDTRDPDTMRFCVNLLPVAAYVPAGTDIHMLRVAVRVWWHRSGTHLEAVNRTIADVSQGLGCQTIPTALEMQDRRIHKIVSYTMVRPR